MSWEVEYTEQFEAWWNGITAEDQEAIDAAVEILEEGGPTLGRPLVDTVKGSRHANMKELRPSGTSLRILFAFDPKRAALLLLGGDKRGEWTRWYKRMIPVADRLYEAHLAELRKEP